VAAEVVVSIAADDIDRSKAFVTDVLGLGAVHDRGEFVSFRTPGEAGLAIYTGDALSFDAGLVSGSYRGATFSLIVDSEGDVDDVLSRAGESGGVIRQDAQRAPWGGYIGYFTDPDSNLWKVVARIHPA
jgi:hypothetical protein